jgi:outer membrane protein assembly factor BamB
MTMSYFKHQRFPLNLFKHLLLWPMISLLIGCAGFFNTDNTPKPASLQPFTPTVTPHRLWASGTPSAPLSNSLKLDPTFNHDTLYTVTENGMVSAIDQHQGRIKWIINTGLPLSSGPGVGQGVIVVGTRTGQVVALREQDGTQLWQAPLPGAVLAKPLVLQRTVIIKATDGVLRALQLADGQVSWSLHQTEPNLILRGASMPFLKNGALFVGFANGSLAKIDAKTGEMEWRRSIAVPEGAFSIERMIDIDANPVSYGYRIITATYQGKISALDEDNGELVWSKDMSSYTGMTTSKQVVYITDADSHLFAFDIDTGREMWRQTTLTARRATAPVIMGRYVVIGDQEGYLHWFNQRDGRPAARALVGDAILADPIVKNGVLYALTRHGLLVAYTLS